MSLAAKIWVFLLVAGVALSAYAGRPRRQKETGSSKCPVKVEDTIRMTRIGGPANAGRFAGFGPRDGIAFPSLDGTRVAIVLRRGNVENNTNVFSLWVFKASAISRGDRPRRLVEFASSSNRDGIARPTWLNDNDTIVFLGARGSAPSELYAVRCSTERWRALTHHSTSLTSFAITPDGRTMTYAAERPAQPVVTEESLRNGFWMDRENAVDVIRDELKSSDEDLFVQNRGHPLRFATAGSLNERTHELSISPNGRYVLVKTNAMKLPESWAEYDDEWIRAALRQHLPPGFTTGIAQYELFDVETGQHSLLLNAPVSSVPTPAVWPPDGTSVILSGVHLPLGVNDPLEKEAHRTHSYVVEIRLPGLETNIISSESLVPVEWHARGNVVSFRRAGEKECEGGKRASVWYERRGTGWTQRGTGSSESCHEIVVDQDLNHPARVVMKNPNTGGSFVLFDLNPQFADLAFAKVEPVRWPDGDGGLVEGGLYLPVDYSPGRKYPLVIQTHGFDPTAFWIEGPHTTAFAAQPLASQGIVVLQLNDIFYDTLVTPKELDRAMHAYEIAIEQLDKSGLIDPERVGLVGFSRTGMYVKYALAHCHKAFAAAVVADANDAGYLQYTLAWPFMPRIATEMDAMFGAPPFGDGLKVWLDKSPGFLLTRVKTPVLIEALGPFSLLNEWEWFSGLKRLQKPVDLLYLPTGTHVLIKPWDRQVSLEATLDWLRFWLTGEENAAPRKKAQYQHWRGLRAARSALEAK